MQLSAVWVYRLLGATSEDTPLTFVLQTRKTCHPVSKIYSEGEEGGGGGGKRGGEERRGEERRGEERRGGWGGKRREGEGRREERRGEERRGELESD